MIDKNNQQQKHVPKTLYEKIDLKKAPYELDDQAINWVHETRNKMTVEQKIGQLFFLVGFTTNEKELKETVTKYHPGGMMYRTSKAKKVVSAHRTLQSHAQIPMFLAANIESGGEWAR